LKIAQRFHRCDWQEPDTKSVKRTAVKSRDLVVVVQPSASRRTNPSALYPSSKLLGYYHSSALRTDKPTLYAKPEFSIGGGKLASRVITSARLAE
jgi:hypothetical protein